MGRQIKLLYFSSTMILEFCKKHPVNMYTRNLAERGDILTPSPAMGEFFDCLLNKGRLITQEDYITYTHNQWHEWFTGLQSQQKEGIVARLARNFYPSAIDTVHAWALLVESGKFKSAVIDILEDAVGKTDLTVEAKNGYKYKIGLSIDNRYSRQREAYKRAYRGDVPDDLIDIRLPMERNKIGNKRWYEIEDFEPLFEQIRKKEPAVNRIEVASPIALPKASNTAVNILSVQQSLSDSV